MTTAGWTRSSRRWTLVRRVADSRGELLDLRLPRRGALAGARPADAGERAGRALPHRRGARSRRAGAAGRRPRRARPPGDGGREHACGARGRRRRAARPDQLRAHARRRHDHRPGLDLDRADGRARGGCGRPPLHGPARAREGRRRRPGRPARRRRGRNDRAGCGGRAVLLPSPGTVLEAGAKAGTFVEIKNSRIGERTKVPHLSYIGDADVGDDSNIAAGNITANFAHEPGKPKGRTTIGRNVRTGVDNTFVAPVTVGDDAWVAAGSVVTDDVPSGALAIARARQVNKEGRGGKGNS